MQSKLAGKRAVVTGAGRGIGEAMARGLAAEDVRVVIADIDAAAAQSVAQSIGANARSIGIDVRNRASVDAAVGFAVSEFGGLDAMFNNAGIVKVVPFAEVTDEEFRTMMDVNALGILIGTQVAARQMQLQGTGGAIVNTASIAGKVGSDLFTHYCASKAAAISLTQSAAKAYGKDKIRVNAICPGMVDTNMWQVIGQAYKDTGLMTNTGDALEHFSVQAVLGRTSVPDDMVGLARFLVSDDSEFITGQSIVVDGGIVFS